MTSPVIVIKRAGSPVRYVIGTVQDGNGCNTQYTLQRSEATTYKNAAHATVALRDYQMRRVPQWRDMAVHTGD